ncbi:MAG TPA: L-histidine N(alpha)-methyltransferase [Candidatus Polarisedimenticolia bacterium]|nr:L-histidine N(alpha)-methyltransferase [Candidatus Polarisedimenticolia bacterium]
MPPAADPRNLAEEIRAGLSGPGQKRIPSRWLYDDVGSALFEVICLMPEYGLARADARILRSHAAEMAALVGRPACVAELGSGSGWKSRLLLAPLAREAPLTYIPIDISRAALARCETEMMAVRGLLVDRFEGEYLAGLSYAAASRETGEPLLVLFLGSTIGNFERAEAEEFLVEIRRILSPGDMILLGTDLIKPEEDLLAAYDDPARITAAFNLNVLARLNRELQADFDLLRFSHEARWNAAQRRIEMHLCSIGAQAVDIPGARLRIALRSGESLWTESSHKFTPEEPAILAQRTGYQVVCRWSDGLWPFSETLLRAD